MLNTKKLIISFFITFLISPLALAEGKFGLNLGIGVPFVSQVGAQFFINDKYSVALEYNNLDVSADDVEAELTMPAIMFYMQPFANGFFVGAGIGKESLEVTGTEAAGTDSIKVTVDANTTILKTGWIWGKEDGGLWFGVDVAYIKPSSADTKITAPDVPTNDPNYRDALDAANDFGDSAYPNITFARVGWIF